MKNPIYMRLCTTIGALVVCGTTAVFTQPINRQLPPHLLPIEWQAEKMIFEEGRAADAIAYMQANPEYLQQRAGRPRFFMVVAHMMLEDWETAYQWAIAPGSNRPHSFFVRDNLRNLLDAFNGNLSSALTGLGSINELWNADVSELVAQGNSANDIKANIAFLTASSFSMSAVERFLLTKAFELAPDAPLIRMRFAGRAEPDVRKSVAILDSLSFPQHLRIQQELEIYQKWHRAALQRAERGQGPFILQNRVLPHSP